MWRDIKIRYRQTLLGGLWAVLQPLIAMLIFTFVFKRLAGVKSDGPPYPLFAFAGLAPWTFFSTALSQSSNSLVANQQLVSKVYFPRVFIPLGAVGAFGFGAGHDSVSAQRQFSRCEVCRAVSDPDGAVCHSSDLSDSLHSRTVADADGTESHDRRGAGIPLRAVGQQCFVVRDRGFS